MPERKRQVKRKKPAATSRGRRKASPKRSRIAARIKKAPPRAKTLLKRGAKVLEEGVQTISRRAESLGNTLLKRLRSSSSRGG